MKSKVTQENVAKKCGLDQGSVSRILNKDKRDSFAKETVDKVLKVARELSYLHPSLVSLERRESERKKAEVTAKIAIVTNNDTIFDEGTCVIDVLSLSGMLLKNFKMNKNVLPMDHLKIDIEITSQNLKGLKCCGRIARFADNEKEFALAIKYEELSSENKDKIKTCLNKS